MSMTKKLFNITVSDVISIALAALIVAWIVDDFNIAGAIGIILGNRIWALVGAANDS
jgi:hypothetical protein